MFEQNIDIAGSESKSLRRKQAQAPLIAFFYCLGLLLCRLMRAVMPPFGFVGEGFLDCGQTAEFEAEFSGCEAFTAYLVLVLREVDDFVAMVAGAGAALGK
jgi:hypothetical protein